MNNENNPEKVGLNPLTELRPEIYDAIKKIFKGDIEITETVLKNYSHDASLFEVRPTAILYPKDSEDIQKLVSWVSSHKEIYPELSITARSAGTCMSGGSLNHSLILDFTRYMNNVIEITSEYGVVEPGCFYRDFEKESLKIDRIMPAFTASKEICAVGGMVANNAGGEKTIKYGKVENYVEELSVVFSDGKEYTVRPLSEAELKAKTLGDTFESRMYNDIWTLIRTNMETIKSAKPNVSKNSAGYYLWNIWDEDKKVFDLCKLIVGSQGTLGIVTKIKWRLVPVEKYSNVLAIFMPNIKNLGALVKEILPFKPDSLESYDDYSMKLAVRFFFDFITYLGPIETLKLGLRFLPEALMMLTGGIPKLTIIVEVSGVSDEAVREKLLAIQKTVRHFKYKTRIARNSGEAEKYWKIRRESFNLLRKHVHNKRTAPFIDDVIVPPDCLPEFLPKLQALIAEYKLTYTVAGHAGNGNFHIIPLMDLNDKYSADVILELSTKVYDLVLKYKGSITAEHNDGIIRTPYLKQMYGEEVYALFKQTKNIFDAKNIFNPGKKVDGTKEDIRAALCQSPVHEIPPSAKMHSS